MIEKPQQAQEPELSDDEAAALLAELGEITLEQIQAAVPKQTPAVALGLDRGGLRQVQPVSRRQYRDHSEDAKLSAMELLKPLPPAGTTLHAVLPGSFTPLDLVPALLELRHTTAKAVILGTLGFSKANVETLAGLLDAGSVKKLALVCSTYFAAGSKDIFALAEQELRPRGAKLIASRSHCKVMLLDLANGEKWVAEGSGNLRSCVALENLALCRDARLWRFHSKWLTKILEAAPC
jgi:hypothetical protein